MELQTTKVYVDWDNNNYLLTNGQLFETRSSSSHRSSTFEPFRKGFLEIYTRDGNGPYGSHPGWCNLTDKYYERRHQYLKFPSTWLTDFSVHVTIFNLTNFTIWLNSNKKYLYGMKPQALPPVGTFVLAYVVGSKCVRRILRTQGPVEACDAPMDIYNSGFTSRIPVVTVLVRDGPLQLLLPDGKDRRAFGQALQFQPRPPKAITVALDRIVVDNDVRQTFVSKLCN
jgi:hypothetical protein